MAHERNGRYGIEGAVAATPLPRELFRVTSRSAYLNHAAVGVLPVTTADAVHRFVQAHADGGVLGVWPYEAKMPEYRAAIARYLGANRDEIAVLRNTSEGAAVLAGGLDWKDGDEIVLSDNEFPANAQPWLAMRRHGVRIRWIETERERLTPDLLARTIGPRTRVVAVSWVSFADGYRHDLAALAQVAHAHGALLCVDAIQGLGALRLDVRATGVDALFCGGAKWMLALQGVAFLYVARELLDAFRPATPGWRSVADMWDFLNYEQPLAPDATRYEGGTPNFVGALSLATSIELFERYSPAAIEKHVLELSERLEYGLLSIGARIATPATSATRSGIVTFTVPDADPVKLGRALQDKGFCTTFRPNGIRVAPHAYNTSDEIDAFVDAAGATFRRR